MAISFLGWIKFRAACARLTSRKDSQKSMVADIRRLMAARPFVPFTIYLTDGRQLRVPTQEHIAYMIADELKRLLTASPFKPFTVYTAGEKAFRIPHPEFAWLSPRGRTLIVGNTPDKGFDIVDVPLISRIEVHKPAKATP